MPTKRFHLIPTIGAHVAIQIQTRTKCQARGHITLERKVTHKKSSEVSFVAILLSYTHTKKKEHKRNTNQGEREWKLCPSACYSLIVVFQDILFDLPPVFDFVSTFTLFCQTSPRSVIIF